MYHRLPEGGKTGHLHPLDYLKHTTLWQCVEFKTSYIFLGDYLIHHERCPPLEKFLRAPRYTVNNIAAHHIM